MDKEQQIVEMANVVDGNVDNLRVEECIEIATAIYDKGYRKPRNGRWIYQEGTLVCSLCKEEILEKTEFSRGCYMGFEYVFSKYYPSCGAKMEGD